MGAKPVDLSGASGYPSACVKNDLTAPFETRRSQPAHNIQHTTHNTQAAVRPFVIIDFSSRYIFALIADQNGRAVPCAFKRHGMFSRYFLTSVYLDPKRYQKTDAGWLGQLNAFIRQNQFNLFFSGEPAGWLRPYEIAAAEGILPIRHPIYALSAFGMTAESHEFSAIMGVSSALLAFLMQPVLKSLDAMGHHPHDFKVIAVVPSYISRSAQKILYKILRAAGFRGILMTDHATALAMHFIGSPFEEIGVLHADENCLFASKFSLKQNESHVRMGCLRSFAVKELGWDAVKKHIATACYEDGRLSAQDDSIPDYLDRGLTALFTGTDIPADSGISLSYGLLTEKFRSVAGQRIRDEISAKFVPVLNELKPKNVQIVTSGLFFMIGEFENLVLNPLGKQHPLKLRQMIAIERAAYGVLHMLNWIRTDPNRRVTLWNHYGIRISGPRESSIELIRSRVFPLKPVENRIIRQVLALDAAENMRGDVLAADILWGNNPVSRYNTSLCTLTRHISADDIREQRPLELRFDLKGTPNGLKGSVSAVLGEGQPQKSPLHFPKFCRSISADDILSGVRK